MIQIISILCALSPLNQDCDPVALIPRGQICYAEGAGGTYRCHWDAIRSRWVTPYALRYAVSDKITLVEFK